MATDLFETIQATKEKFTTDFELLYCSYTGYSYGGHRDFYNQWCVAAPSLTGLGFPPAGQPLPVFVEVAHLYLCYKTIKGDAAKVMTWPNEQFVAMMVARLS